MFQATYMHIPQGGKPIFRHVTYPSAKAARAAIRAALHGSTETAIFDGWIYRFDARRWEVRRAKASPDGRPQL